MKRVVLVIIIITVINSSLPDLAVQLATMQANPFALIGLKAVGTACTLIGAALDPRGTLRKKLVAAGAMHEEREQPHG